MFTLQIPSHVDYKGLMEEASPNNKKKRYSHVILLEQC